MKTLKLSLPELPVARRARLQADWGLSGLDMMASHSAGALDLVEATVEAGAPPGEARKWWLTELSRRADEAGTELSALNITPVQVARVIDLVASGAFNDRLARQVLAAVLAGEGGPDEVIASHGLAVVTDEGKLAAAVDEAIETNVELAGRVRSGKVAAAGALVGAVMKMTRGRANPTRASSNVSASPADQLPNARTVAGKYWAGRTGLSMSLEGRTRRAREMCLVDLTLATAPRGDHRNARLGLTPPAGELRTKMSYGRAPCACHKALEEPLGWRWNWVRVAPDRRRKTILVDMANDVRSGTWS